MDAPASNRPPQGWVTVADAAAALTKAGDEIDPSNVSRYLQAHPEVPSKKFGKYRYVDPVALKAHRDTNVMVTEKRGARGLSVAASAPQLSPVKAELPLVAAIEDPTEVDQGSPLNAANLQLKQLQIRNQEIDLAEKEGKLVPATEVLALAAGVVETFVGELERGEVEIAQSMGREAGAAFRKHRKAAQLKASAKLIELAKNHLPPALALAASTTESKDVAA